MIVCLEFVVKLSRNNGGPKTKRPQQIDDVPVRNIQRADMIPTTGFAMVVDGKMKTNFEDKASATKAGSELLARFPMLQIEVYDASAGTRSKIQTEKSA
jgi:hypothetical protein